MKISSGFDLPRAAREVSKIDEIMEQSNRISDSLDRNAASLFSPFSEVSPDIKAQKEAAITDTAKMRSPEILNTRITEALSANSLNAAAWDAASTSERITMTKKMFNTMLEEMQIPKEICDKVKLWYFGSDSPTSANRIFSNRYDSIFKQNDLGNLELKDNPHVQMHYGLLYQNFDTALGALYNQAIHIMQQATCIEPAGTYADSVEQAKWAAEVKDIVRNQPVVHNDMHLFAASAEKEMLDRYHNIIKTKSRYNTHTISFK